MAKKEMDPSEFFEKALLVVNLRSVRPIREMSVRELKDKLTIHFHQRKTSRGGDVKEVIYPLNSRKDDAIVVFEDTKGTSVT